MCAADLGDIWMVDNMMRNGVVLQHMHGLYMEQTCEICGNITGDMGDVCHDILVYSPIPEELYACMLRVSQVCDECRKKADGIL